LSSYHLVRRKTVSHSYFDTIKEQGLVTVPHRAFVLKTVSTYTSSSEATQCTNVSLSNVLRNVDGQVLLAVKGSGDSVYNLTKLGDYVRSRYGGSRYVNYVRVSGHQRKES